MCKSEVTLLFMAAGALVACGGKPPPEPFGSSASAITRGAPDPVDDGVVALTAGELVWCTASVVAPSVVLTAAHCVAGVAPAALPDVTVGSSPASSGRRIGVERTWVHPLYDPATHSNDIALLVTKEPIGLPPLSINQSADALAAGDAVKIAGFGRTTAGDEGSLSRRDGEATIARMGATTLRLAPDPSLPCYGDSGGPVLLEVSGAWRIVGVVSFGTANCTSYAVATRVDAYTREFLEPFTAEHTAGAGGRCLTAANCEDGVCVAPDDAPSISYCDRPCSAPGDCAAPMVCTMTSAGSRCRFPEPSPGALGTACSSDADCSGALCARSARGAPGACSSVCFPDDESPCPPSDECLPNASVEGAYACFTSSGTASTGASCSIGDDVRSGDADAAVVALVAACAWIRRRRPGIPANARG